MKIINTNFERGMFFKGMYNGRIIKITNVSKNYITYLCIDNGKTFTTNRKTMECCYLVQIS